MAATFEARYWSDCSNCGWRIKPGDLATYTVELGVVHVVCPEDVGLWSTGEVCIRCFMEKSAAGTCGCD